jgi:hypothetical protein
MKTGPCKVSTVGYSCPCSAGDFNSPREPPASIVCSVCLHDMQHHDTSPDAMEIDGESSPATPGHLASLLARKIDRCTIKHANDSNDRLDYPEPDDDEWIPGFACLHEMLWGKSTSGLSQITKERSVEVPQFSMQVEPSLNSPQQPISTNINDYSVIDIKESDFFKRYASELEDLLNYLLPCAKTEFLLLNDYPMLYDMVMERDIKSIGCRKETRAHSTICGQPGIGRFLNPFYTGRANYKLTKREIGLLIICLDKASLRGQGDNIPAYPRNRTTVSLR